MSIEHPKLLLFGDENVDKASAMQAIIRYSRASAAVRTFLSASLAALKDEVERVYPGELTDVESFDEILYIADELDASNQIHEIIAGVFICVARLGEMILYTEEDPSTLGTSERPIRVLGFCAGEVPGAVAVAAQDLAHLMNLSVEAVRLMFRFYQQMMERTVLVDHTDGSWGTTVIGMTQAHAQEILDDFHECEDVPYERRICIGVVSAGWITIVGCPTSMDSLLEWSHEIADLPRIDVFGRGSVHMYNLPEVDIGKVLGISPLLDTVITDKAKMISPYDCKYRQARTLRSLLHKVISDVCQKEMYVSNAVTRAISEIESEEATLVVAGYTGHSPLVQKEMMAAGIDVNVSNHCSVEA